MTTPDPTISADDVRKAWDALKRVEGWHDSSKSPPPYLMPYDYFFGDPAKQPNCGHFNTIRALLEAELKRERVMAVCKKLEASENPDGLPQYHLSVANITSGQRWSAQATGEPGASPMAVLAEMMKGVELVPQNQADPRDKKTCPPNVRDKPSFETVGYLQDYPDTPGDSSVASGSDTNPAVSLHGEPSDVTERGTGITPEQAAASALEDLNLMSRLGYDDDAILSEWARDNIDALKLGLRSLSTPAAPQPDTEGG